MVKCTDVSSGVFGSVAVLHVEIQSGGWPPCAKEDDYDFTSSLLHYYHHNRTLKATSEMKLTIIAPEMVYEHEVDSSMQVQDIIALVEAEVCPA